MRSAASRWHSESQKRRRRWEAATVSADLAY